MHFPSLCVRALSVALLASLLSPRCCCVALHAERVGDGSFLSNSKALRASAQQRLGASAATETQTLEQLYSNAHRKTPSSMAQADGGGGGGGGLASAAASPTSPMASMMRFAKTATGLQRTRVGSYSMGGAVGRGQAHANTGLEAVREHAKVIGSTAAAEELAKELAWEKQQERLHSRGW